MEAIATTYRRLVPESLRRWIWEHFTRDLRRWQRRGLRRRDPQPVEPHLQLVLGAFLSPGDCYVDVGACVGGLALVAGRLVGPNGRLVCFEPAAWNYRKLRRNLARAAGLPTQVETHNAAVGDRCGTTSNDPTARSHAPTHNAAVGDRCGTTALFTTFADECHTTIRGVNDGSGYLAEIEVPLVTLDSTIGPRGRPPSPSLIKIDVEGAEPAVLRGARGLLSTARPMLIVEIGNPQHDKLSGNPKETWSLMCRAGYHGWVIDADFIAPWTPSVCFCRQDVLFVPDEARESTIEKLKAGGLSLHEVMTARLEAALRHHGGAPARDRGASAC